MIYHKYFLPHHPNISLEREDTFYYEPSLRICKFYDLFDFPGGSYGKASAYNVGDLGLIPGLGRSPGEGNGNPLQYSCLENPMDGGTW